MASIYVSRQSQPGAVQHDSNSLFSTQSSRDAKLAASNDPLQPLRAMADRVGKEVEKFAERVDHWLTHGNENSKAKYQTTVKMVGKFRDLAESHVKELKMINGTENKGNLSKSVRQRIQTVVEISNHDSQDTFGQSSLSIAAPSNHGSTLESKNIQELRQWQTELATWELLRLIVDHYHMEPGTDILVAKKRKLARLKEASGHSKNSQIWDCFLAEDDQAREKAIVRRWLEETARNNESDIESITSELESASGKVTHIWTSGWLDTKSRIKQAKRLEGADRPLDPAMMSLKTVDKTASLVTQLDPDAPTRQKRALEKSDEYHERALWMVCYEMMRRGVPWEQIIDWCQERNEGWRGVSMGAAYEAHPEGGPNVGGLTVGYLFRRMCFYAARGARVPYEGAVYGILSGDAKQVQAVSRSWDDHLYAHYNALLLSRFDAYLQQRHPDLVDESLAQKFVFEDAVSNIGDWETSPQKVVELLRRHKLTASQSLSPSKLIQGALIGRGIESLITKVGVALADLLKADNQPQGLVIRPESFEDSEAIQTSSKDGMSTPEQCHQLLASDPHAFRILVHIFIVFQRGLLAFKIENEKQSLAMGNVVAAYIEFLRITKRIQLIPLYAAQLEPERAAHCLARVLPDIKNSEEQRRCVALMGQYRLDVVLIVSQSFLFAFENSGSTEPDAEGFAKITDPIRRFKLVETVTTAQEQMLWPGARIRQSFDGLATEAKEEAIIEALQWYHYVGNDYEQTFTHLKNALTIFLLKGRLGPAERIVNDLSVESLSLSRTEALCGYPFDITTPNAEEQDERRLHDHRDSLSGVARAAAIPLANLPDAEQHMQLVQHLREKSSGYYDLQQMVRLIGLFREWREEEETLIKIRNDRQRDPSAQKVKPDTQRTKELLDAITTIFTLLIASISASPTAHDPTNEPDDWSLKKAYIPDMLLAYLSVLQSASYFLQRDPAIQAMDVAVLVADEANEWLQKVLLETGRMSELVDCLACVSKAMLRLTENKVEKKKRGGKGETLRIWDLGSRH